MLRIRVWLLLLLTIVLVPSASAVVKASLSMRAFGTSIRQPGQQFGNFIGGVTARIQIPPHAGTVGIPYAVSAGGSSGTNPTQITININSGDGPGVGLTSHYSGFEGPVSGTITHSNGEVFTVGMFGKPLRFGAGPATGPNTGFVSLDLPDGTPCPVVLGSNGPPDLTVAAIFTCIGAPLTIYTSSLRDAAMRTDGTSPAQILVATGGLPPYSWALQGRPEDIPPGVVFFSDGTLQVDRNSALRSNRPFAFGSYDFTVAVQDTSNDPNQVTRLTRGFNLKIVCGESPEKDTDQDGLKDCWELGGIDATGDGKADIILAGPQPGGKSFIEDAPVDPLRKDIFVEVDWMAQHKPSRAVFDPVVVAFRDSPGKGIRLHILLDEEAVNHFTELSFTDDISRTIYSNKFGTANERENQVILREKKRAYRYALFVHNFAPLCSERRTAGLTWPVVDGQTFIGGRTMSVAGAALTPHPGGHAFVSNLDLAATFMHELGHALGLDHGGADGVQLKPNYISVMNYGFTYDKRPVRRRLDFSRSALPILDENVLSERAGIGLPDAFGPFFPIAFGPPVLNASTGKYGPTIIQSSGGAIDWDLDGNTFEVSGPRDLNTWFFRSSSSSCAPQQSVPVATALRGHDDWANINVSLQRITDLENANSVPVQVLAESWPIEELQSITPDFDGDGKIGFEDNCADTYNPGQEDVDGDTVGDACSQPVAGDVDGNRKVDCKDILMVRAMFGRRRGDVVWDTGADLNQDGVVDARDLQIVARALPAGTVCQ